jgi:hypothetical protein
MAVTSEQILGFLNANPGISDAEIVAAMEQYGVSPAQMASAVGVSEGEVAARVAATVPQGQTVTLGDTIVQPQYQVIGSGEDQQIGGIENVYTYKVGENQTGGGYNQYNPDGTLARTGTQQEVKSGLKEFAIGAGLLFGLPSILNAGAAGAPAIGNGAFLGEGVASGVPAFDAAFTSAGGVFNPAFGLPIGNGAFLGEGVPTGIPASDAAFLNAGGVFNPAFALGADGLIGTPLTTTGLPPIIPTTGLPPTAVSPTGVSPTVVPPTGTPSVIPPLVKSVIPAAVSGLLTPTNVSNLISGGLTTAGSLLQQQASKEAALAAQQRIDAETAAAKQAAAFRPVGMTTRFGTSQFGFDPTTGQMTSAGYTLSPEAKAQQDRFVALSNQGLTQAEGAQAQFAPLQTGAQSLFSLGNQYISQSPQSVAENYLKQQMALLQPGRELELANLQTKLRNQGRMGLSVSQGGNLGATTPELQALYNARAQQEAVLAANAQQAGQQQVLYGAGLLGQGSQAMGQYYGGQQAAYAPYTAAQGQVQNLETLGQQPFNMSNALAQQTSLAGARTGQLGLSGAELSTRLATSANATANPYAQALMAAGNPNAMFGQSLNNVFGGLFGNAPVTAMSAPATSFGSGNYYGSQDLGLYL